MLFNAVVLMGAALLAFSCENKITVTTFEPEIVIQGGTNDVVDGQPFTFRIYSETGRLVINSLEIRSDAGRVAYSPDRSSNDFPIQGVTLGAEVTCGSDGWAVFSAESVYVPEKSIYTLTAVVSEPSTSNSVTLKETFKGRTSMSVNEVAVTGFCKNSSVITTGTELSVSTKFSKRSFHLDSYHLPYGCSLTSGSYMPVEGKDYNLPEDCVWRFGIVCGSVTEDHTDSLCFDVTDTDTGTRSHIRYASDILCRYPFSCSIRCDDVNSDNGSLTLTVTSNRSVFTPTLLEVTPGQPDCLVSNGTVFSAASDKSFTSFFGAYSVDYPDRQLVVGAEGTYGNASSDEAGRAQAMKFRATGVSSTQTQDVSLRFRLKDSQTDQELERTCTFTVRSSTSPKDMQLFYLDDNGNEQVMGTASDSDLRIYVGYNDGSPEGLKRGTTDLSFRFLTDGGSAITEQCSCDISVDNPTASDLKISSDASTWVTSLKGQKTGQGTGVCKFYIKGGKPAGDKTVRITVTDPGTLQTTTFTVKIYVRYRCAVVIDGTVADDIKQTTMAVTWAASGGTGNVGWYGLVSSLTANIYEYTAVSAGGDPVYNYRKSNPNAKTFPEIGNNVLFSSPSIEATASLRAGMKWSAGHQSPVFYGSLGDKQRLWVNWIFYGGDFHWSFYAGGEAAWPKMTGTGESIACQASTVESESTLESLAEIVNRYNDNVRLVSYNRNTYEGEIILYNEGVYESIRPSSAMSFFVNNVSWTDKALDIRYVIFKFKCGTDYWWKTFDNGSWCAEVNDITVR